MLPFSPWLLPLLLLGSVAPGVVLTAQLKVRPGDRLTVATAVSIFSTFCSWWCLWIAGVPAAWCSLIVLAGCCLLAVSGWRNLRAVLTMPLVRWQAAAWLAVAGHALLLHAAVFSYSGGLWGGDWCGHLTQAGFFLADGDPRPNRFPGGDAITGRPPLENIVAAHFWRLGRGHYADYQVVMTWLNSLACLPVLMLVSRLTPRRQNDQQQAVLLTAVAVMVLPAFAQNAVYPWTKLLAAFFVVPGLVFWADGAGRGRRPHRELAAGLLAAGLLVHYSAAVYVVAVVGFELVPTASQVIRRDWPRLARSFMTNLRAAAVAVAVVAPWLGWALWMYGPRGTFATNTAVVDARVYSLAENLLKMLLNIRDTLLPSFLRGPTDLTRLFQEQASLLGWIRDSCFLPYQVNFPAALGVVGWAAVLPAAGVIRRALPRSPGLFWSSVAAVSLMLGVAAHGGRDDNGLAQICCHPLMLLGAGLIVAAVPRLPGWLRGLVLAGWVVDYLVGTLLQAWVQSWRFALTPPAAPRNIPGNTAGLSLCATTNLANKVDLGVVFMADRLDSLGLPSGLPLLPAGLLAVGGLAVAGRSLWQQRVARAGGNRPG